MREWTRRRGAGLLGLVLLAGPWFTFAPAAKADELLVFAAASLKTALDEINTAYRKEKGTEIKVSYAASSQLARQIEQGAPADVFMSADLDWMNYLGDRHLIDAETRTSLLGNELVLVAPKDSALDKVEIKRGFDLAALLKGGHLAMAQVESVPAGKYGKAALEHLDAWSGLKGKVAQADNVRAALALVARGEAPLGIVYKTDATAEPGVKIVGTFPADSHPPIIYPVAVTTESTRNAAARDYLAYLRSPTAKSAFTKEGFTVLSGPGA